MRFMLGADAEWDTWVDIVAVTRWHYNDDRLKWDVLHIAHHCSYTGLSDGKGEEVTEPVYEVEYLFDQGNTRAILISPSQKIPAVDTDQPPHRQAAAFYRRVATQKEGQFIVTMNWPFGAERPIPVVIETSENGFTLKKSTTTGSAAITSSSSPRFGKIAMTDIYQYGELCDQADPVPPLVQRYLEAIRRNPFTETIGLFKLDESFLLDVEFSVETPQFPPVQIFDLERIGIKIYREISRPVEVYALRKEFPHITSKSDATEYPATALSIRRRPL
ncbi:MAG: hypothetical protein IPK52_27225 [Chloroflexi bacterium]|nr:hypothetical protein [Chloroflexota bacterium]